MLSKLVRFSITTMVNLLRSKNITIMANLLRLKNIITTAHLLRTKIQWDPTEFINIKNRKNRLKRLPGITITILVRSQTKWNRLSLPSLF